MIVFTQRVIGRDRIALLCKDARQTISSTITTQIRAHEGLCF